MQPQQAQRLCSSKINISELRFAVLSLSAGMARWSAKPKYTKMASNTLI
jgi:hypothetical protein